MKSRDFAKTRIGKKAKFETEHKVYCENPKCKGHGVVFYDPNVDRILCNNCHEYICRDKKTKLKYEMKERGILK